MAHYAIYIPGLFDKLHYKIGQRTALLTWYGSGVRPYYFVPNWANKDEPFAKKLDRLTATIDRFANAGHKVSLVAASAGSSMALLAYLRRRNRITRVVSICGKLRRPDTVPAPLFAANPAFKAAIHDFMRHEHELTRADANKLLIVRAARDSYVPDDDGGIQYAHTYKLHSVGHVFSILLALTIFKWSIIHFLRHGTLPKVRRK